MEEIDENQILHLAQSWAWHIADIAGQKSLDEFNKIDLRDEIREYLKERLLSVIAINNAAQQSLAGDEKHRA